mmetsp:Transcript_10420/g.10410  ORF Transcript_10420/g.10410 Transcript_10420/m.10410 type:complete len:112 (-) Transcript_10420:33-368(-)|eukprot:CAMPEP_0202943398 /NCGR_PEP_ID=MMETSP1395-20130829/3831_1 /ASSEMBLY_ACC=CAM_ASM_000871 /TAXON_ID=5961 /ORGANISM="Blepharisma japonicum, Strain Stock R1072" /LENGTH=111 /DNA_ID=CAMNT_0049640823 /DNA_START=42 /DNA_END=377 /DNA_ORIENTATION=+
MGKKAGKPKVAKRAKREKKDGPKKPKSAFMFFSQERRITLKTEQPDLKITEQSKVIGAEWGKLSDADKAPYAEKASQDKERYIKEKANQPAPVEEEEEEEKKEVSEESDED